MNVLVACEFSGVVREAFRARGHNAWSCDLLPAEDGSKFHYHGELTQFLTKRRAPVFDLMIAHPPCTYLTVSANPWLKQPGRLEKQGQAVTFAHWLMEGGFGYLRIPRICVENPVGILSTRIRKPDQIIQPWHFGHQEMKATCLWLKNLPPLTHTNVVGPPPQDEEQRKSWAKCHRATPGKDRWKDRSRTYTGIAAAMAEQWGSLANVLELRA